MNRSARRCACRLALALAVACPAVGQAQQAAQPPQPLAPPSDPNAPNAKPQFAGQVRIAGRIADPGVSVQVILFHSAQKWTICAEGEVRDIVEGNRYDGFWYVADLSASVECNNRSNLFQFYVNGVWGGSARYEFSAKKPLKIVHLAAPEVALDTPKQSGLELFWVYGTVKKRSGGPAPDGTVVSARARGQDSCAGTGKTHRLQWQPRGADRVPIDAKGFYSIAIPMKGCADRSLLIDVFVGKSDKVQSSGNVHSPNYGTPVSANGVLDD